MILFSINSVVTLVSLTAKMPVPGEYSCALPVPGLIVPLFSMVFPMISTLPAS
jgi:hypothetical protein